jgi:hypothetical protein
MVCSNCKLIKKKHKFVLNEYKLWIKQQHIVKIFYMWMLCITLKERNTKRFVQNWRSPKSPPTEWSWFFFYRTCNVFYICYAVGLLQYSKSVWSKVGTLTVYMLISCIVMPKNRFRSGKSCKMYANDIHKVFKFWGIFSTFLN